MPPSLRDELDALLHAIAAERPLGHRVAPQAAPGLRDAVALEFRIAVHPLRPALRVRPDGAVVHEGRSALFAATPARALARLRAVASLADDGYSLVVACDDATPLAHALGATVDPDLPGVWRTHDVVLEPMGSRTFVTCRTAHTVARVLDVARAVGHAIRVVDEGAAIDASLGVTAPQGEVLAACGDAREGLRLCDAGDGRFVQQRIARGEVASWCVASPGQVGVAAPRGADLSPRVARWMVRQRLAFLDGLRDAARDNEVARAALAAGCTVWPALVDTLAGLVALGEWGGVANDRLGPWKPRDGEPVRTVASPWGPLLPWGVVPFGDGALFVDPQGTLVGAPWLDAPQRVPLASSGRSLLEKAALDDELLDTPVGRAPRVRVVGVAGKDFWRRLRAARDEAASDAVSEHWLGDGVWVLRGPDAEGRPGVRLSAVDPDARLTLARRLARAAGLARLHVDCAGPEGFACLRQLRAAGLDAVTDG